MAGAQATVQSIPPASGPAGLVHARAQHRPLGKLNIGSGVNLITARRLPRRLCCRRQPGGILRKVRSGMTSLEEVMACTSE